MWGGAAGLREESVDRDRYRGTNCSVRSAAALHATLFSQHTVAARAQSNDSQPQGLFQYLPDKTLILTARSSAPGKMYGLSPEGLQSMQSTPRLCPSEVQQGERIRMEQMRR